MKTQMQKWQISLLILFVATQVVFEILAQTLLGQPLLGVEYFSIALCFILSVCSIKKQKFNFVLSIGLAFTLCADACLVLNVPPKQAIGMVFFSLSQITYAIYLMLYSTKKINIGNIISRVLGSALIVLITYLVLKDKFDFLSAISMFYIYNLVLNMIFAFVDFKKHKFLSFGFVLFLICDIFIGLASANGTYLTISNQGLNNIINSNIAWLFYIPSQVLIALSTIFDKPSELPTPQNSTNKI